MCLDQRYHHEGGADVVAHVDGDQHWCRQSHRATYMPTDPILSIRLRHLGEDRSTVHMFVSLVVDEEDQWQLVLCLLFLMSSGSGMMRLQLCWKGARQHATLRFQDVELGPKALSQNGCGWNDDCDGDVMEMTTMVITIWEIT